MKKRNFLLTLGLFGCISVWTGCDSLSKDPLNAGFVNPGDTLGGGGVADYIPTETDNTLVATAQQAVGTPALGLTEIPQGATRITEEYEITVAGDYYIDSAIDGKISISAEGVTLYLKNSTLTINCLSDGIQADSFVYSTNNTKLNITSNGGAPTTITETSSDNGSGKGIKVGALDWGVDDTDLEEADYFIYIDSGNYTINANDDAIHSDNSMLIKGGTFDVTTGDDGIKAEELLEIEGGEIVIHNCYEGIEAAKVEISGGAMDITSVDDGINAADGSDTRVNVANNNCHIIISGGDILVNAQGDGVDSNGSFLFSGGKLIVSGSTNGMNSALDADGNIIVNGGSLFATGALGMVETPASNSEQYCVSFAQNSKIKAGTVLTLVDANGNVLLEDTLAKDCQSIILSCPGLSKGESYSIYGGDTELCSFTISKTITSVGSSTSIGNPGGCPNFGGGRW